MNAITNENNIKVTLKCSVLSSTSSLQKFFSQGMNVCSRFEGWPYGKSELMILLLLFMQHSTARLKHTVILFPSQNNTPVPRSKGI